MNEPRVLVTGVGSNIGQGIVKALRLAYPRAYVLGTDADPRAAGFYACDAGLIVPLAREDSYGEVMASAMDDHGIELVLIGSHGESPRMARLRNGLEERTGAVIVVSAAAAVDACVDKYQTVERLRDAGCHYPRSTVDTATQALAGFVRDVGFPLIVKPRAGQGSRGLHIAETMDELERACQRVGEPLVQEYLGDATGEYTTAVLLDRYGALAGVVTMRRDLVAGSTVLAEIGDYPEVAAEACRVVRALGLAGPNNVQMRMTERGPVTFEVNPRFSGTTAMRALAGWNDVAAVVRHYLYGEPMAIGQARPGRVLRFHDEVFVPAAEVDRVAATGRWPTEQPTGVKSLSLFAPEEPP